MSLVIGLSRIGRKGEAKYKVVVREARARRDGRPVATLGYYEKKVDGISKNIDMKRLSIWREKGAQLSEGVRKILSSFAPPSGASEGFMKEEKIPRT